MLPGLLVGELVHRVGVGLRAEDLEAMGDPSRLWDQYLCPQNQDGTCHFPNVERFRWWGGSWLPTGKKIRGEPTVFPAKTLTEDSGFPATGIPTSCGAGAAGAGFGSGFGAGFGLGLAASGCERGG